MNISITDHDKAAEKVIQDLAKKLQTNLDSFEFATSNPQKYITMSILDIRIALCSNILHFFLMPYSRLLCLTFQLSLAYNFFFILMHSSVVLLPMPVPA